MLRQNHRDTDFDFISERAGKILLIIIFIIALLARLELIDHHKLPFGDNDGTNLEVAKNLIEGKGFTSKRKWLYFKNFPESIFHPIYNRQPLLPVILASCFKITGVSFQVGKSVILIFGLLALFLSYKLSRLWFSRDVALLSTFIIAINPTQIWFSSSIDDQILFQLLLFVILHFYYKHDLSQTDTRNADFYILGLWVGLSYLSRNNGLLVMAALGLDMIWRYRKPKFWRKLFLAGIIVWLGFLTSAGWWVVRNYAEFGSPFFTRNTMFLYNEDMFRTVWEVRDEPPSPAEFFKTHTTIDIIKRQVKGFYRVIEPFLMGNIFHNELFSQGNMIGFVLFALALLPAFRNFSRHRFLIIITVLHLLSFSAHQHVFRYLMPFYVLVYILGTAGFLKVFKHLLKTQLILDYHLKSKKRIALCFILIFLILIFPHIRPLRSIYSFDDSDEYEATMHVVDWIKSNVKKGEIIMEYRFLERLVYLYDTPTLIIPNSDFNTIMSIAREYQVKYFIIYRDILRYRYGLASKWFIRDGEIYSQDIPDYMKLVYTDPTKSYLVYLLEWNKHNTNDAS